MPSVHKPRDLYQLSLLAVLKNSRRWMPPASEIINNARKSSGTYVSPFNTLPPTIAQDLLDTYERHHGASAHNNNHAAANNNNNNNDYNNVRMCIEQARWRLFVTCHVTKITITSSTDKNSLRHVAATCQNLRSVELQGVGSAERTLMCLKSLSKALRSITTLDIQLCTLGASALKFIREECRNLWVLRLSSCCVTDKAILALKRLHNLIEVDLRETDVTAIGASRFLKRNPQLMILRHPDLAYALPRLAAKSVTLHLRELHLSIIESAPVTQQVAHNVVTTCPQLELLNIELDHVPHHADLLCPLAALQHLTELHVHCMYSHVTLSPKLADTMFTASIAPVLRSRGHQLKVLSLECVIGVDLNIIETLCPILKELALYFNLYTYNSDALLPNLTGLRKLKFGSQAGGGDNMTEATLKALLGRATTLEELSLASSPLYTDLLFQKVFEVNTFQCLRRLELDYCEVPWSALEWFLLHDLHELSISGQRAHEQASQALALVQQKGLPTALEAYTYSFMCCQKRIVRYKQVNIRA